MQKEWIKLNLIDGYYFDDGNVHHKILQRESNTRCFGLIGTRVGILRSFMNLI